MALIIDITDNADLVETSDGFRATRTAAVTNLSGSTPSAMLLDALNTVGMPDIGDPHPDIASIQVLERRARPAAGTTGCKNAIVNIIYGRKTGGGSFSAVAAASDTGPTIIRGSFRLSEVSETKDLSATTLAFEAPESVYTEIANTTRPESHGRVQVREVSVLRPQHVIQHERLEENPPIERARQHIGKRNSVAHAPYGIEDLLFEGVDYTSTDGGLTYQCTYYFSEDSAAQHNIAELGWIDPSTGQPHPDNTATVATGKTYPSLRTDVEFYDTTNLETALDIDFG